MSDTDHVVLLDDDGRAIGTAPKSSVHGTDTALHLAFSCHVVNDDGQVLVTRRALGKTHVAGRVEQLLLRPPAPCRAGAHRGAPQRRLRAGHHAHRHRARAPPLPLPRHRRQRHRRARGVPRVHRPHRRRAVLNPLEVVDAKWVDPARSRALARRRRPWAFSPWLVLQAEQLHLFDADPPCSADGHHDPARAPARPSTIAIDGALRAHPRSARGSWVADSSDSPTPSRRATHGGKRLRPALVAASFDGVRRRPRRHRRAVSRWRRRSSCCTPRSSCTTT